MAYFSKNNKFVGFYNKTKMKESNNKIQLFENKQIRALWDENVEKVSGAEVAKDARKSLELRGGEVISNKNAKQLGKRDLFVKQITDKTQKK